MIRSLGREKTLIMSSHILQEIEATVDRIIIIHNGQIVADGLREELMSSFRGQTQLTLEVKRAEDESVQGLPEQLQGVALPAWPRTMGPERSYWNTTATRIPGSAFFNMPGTRDG